MLTRLFAGTAMKVAGGIILLLLACLPLSYCQGRSDGKAIEKAKWEKAQQDAKARAETANATAAESRIQDIVRNIDMERARNDAIDKAIPAGTSAAPDAANRALACRRLREAGINASASGC